MASGLNRLTLPDVAATVTIAVRAVTPSMVDAGLGATRSLAGPTR